jgi:hypothetical protein
MRNPHITTTLIVALAISAAPAAAASSSSTSPAVLPNPDEQTLTSNPQPPAPPAPSQASATPCSEICSGGPTSPVTTSTGPGSEVIDNGGYDRPKTPATVVHVTTPQSFDWGDAGIGAAGALGLTMLALGAALTVSLRRARRTKRPTTLAS